jgi:hypothetical protein
MKPTSIIKKVTPKFVKRPIKAALFWRNLDAAMRSEDLMELVKAWGNEGMAARLDYLGAIRESARAATSIIECGSGLSTLIIGLSGTPTISLEDNPEWAERVARAVSRYHLPVSVIHAPLREYEGFDWYQVPPNLPYFDLAVCDGPISSTTRGGRMGFAHVLKTQLKPSIKILLDDTSRPEDAAVASEWADQFGWTVRDCGTFSVLNG